MSLRSVLSQGTARAITWCSATRSGASSSAWLAASSEQHLGTAGSTTQHYRGQRGRYSAAPSFEDFDIMGKDASRVIESYSIKGFVVGGVEYQGSVFLYQELSLLWKVNAVSDITPDSLLAARAVKPQPDLLIIGCGDKIMQLPEATLEAFRNSETLLEVLDTPNAIATFNILVQEGRLVAAAMILPSKM
mmetsp:Transcript_17457/g.43238  ORF Transcript_17457/g.43238 Transcript_17457/m.43238 type:complete len:190 (-) Transcript_17457:915-1484(-)